MRPVLLALLVLLSACAARPLPYAPPEAVEAPQGVPPGIKPLTMEQAEEAG